MNYTEVRRTLVFDCEVFRDYFLIMFRDMASDRRRGFEMYDGHPLDMDGIRKLLRSWRTIGFNSNSYDVPIITLALSGASCGKIKQASDAIILGGLKPWEFYDQYGLRQPKSLDHIDLIEVAPGQASLKIYGGRLHSRRMQDLPYEPDAKITPGMRPVVFNYCGNDLQTTIDLDNELAPQLALRAELSNQYCIDVRSKSDAQVAEAVIRHELEEMTGERIQKPGVKPGVFHYRAPDFIRYDTPGLRSILADVLSANFVVRRDGRVDMPKELDEAKIAIGGSVYRLGIGGLHSSEESASYETDDDYELIDADVGSYYPSLIITNKFIPKALGVNFLKVYKSIYTRRMAAKHAGNKAVAETLKIVLNGTFGKLGSPYSIMYSPDLMIQVTVTGQLALLMLIERLEQHGIHVVSANTDGLVSRVPRHLRGVYEAVLFDWECDTGLSLEMTFYKSIHSRDVNNYIAITTDGKVKRKGAYAAAGPGQPGAFGLKKNPVSEISVEAAIAYLKEGVPIETTIEGCNDIRKFLTIRQVRGGALVDPETLPHLDGCGLTDDERDTALRTGEPVLLGKAIRWYYANDVRGAIHYKANGNTVPRSEGAMPCMELPDDLPDNINYPFYAREAYGILHDVGARYVDPFYRGRRGIRHGRLPNQKNFHLVDMSTGVALCGKATGGPRVRWIEAGHVPDGHRLCAKCRREDTL